MAELDKSRWSRALRALLVVSLALNIAVIGLVAGFALRKDRMGPPRAIELAFGPIGGALSQEDRHAIVNNMRENRDLRPPGRADGGDLAALVDALKAVPFDPIAFAAAMDGVTARKEALKAAAQNAFIKRVTAMPDAERLAFAERLERSKKRN